MLALMLLIASALSEELETALNQCSDRKKIRCGGIALWTGRRAGETLHMLKLGVGPVRSAGVLERALTAMRVTEILLVGYGGALDRGLKQGELVIVERADLLSVDSPETQLEDLIWSGSWILDGAAEMLALAGTGGLPARRGAALTSPLIIGAPHQKQILFEKYHASLVDMETAAVARSAAAAGVAVRCVRAVSDEAADDFLSPISYDPATGLLRRTARVLAAGNWRERYFLWRERSLAARASLRRFLALYLDRKTVA